jgi:ABC transport system ATP-binding/permease protein
VLNAQDLHLSLASRVLLDGASLTVDRGERVALLGDNGAGKSTLLGVLAGARTADDGQVRIAGKGRLGLLAQEPLLDPEVPVVEVVRQALAEHYALLEEHERLCAEGGSGERIAALSALIEEGAGFDVEHRVEQVLSRLSIVAREQPVRSLSGGERRRVDLARLLLSAPDVLLLDEPTNHLDARAVSWLAEHLRRSPAAVLFVSHDRAFVDEVATRIVELDEGHLFTHPTPYSTFLEARLVRKDTEARSLDKRKRLVARELAWLRAGTPARSTKQSARIQRAEALIDEVAIDIKRQQDRKADLVKKRGERLAKTILELNDLTVARGERVLIEDLTLALVQGERWGIVGPNGAGKTSLLEVIVGNLPPSHGKVVLGARTKVAVFDQHRKDLDPSATLDEVLTDGGDWVNLEGERLHVCTLLERYLFHPDDRHRKVGTLSGGEQNRLQLAKGLLEGANCLLLDEPTNDLDIATLGLLEEILSAHEGCALLVSHDRRFLDRVCTGILAFEGTKVVAYQGDYTTYERLRPPDEADAPLALSRPVDERKRREKTKRSYKEEREYEGIEQSVLAAEERRERLAAELQDKATRDPERAKDLAEELARTEAEVERLYGRWQELEGIAG